ncbi:hypothetical protein TNCV_682711 [Trichonephila clavipes]|nr:hypothetical protein TNCV_682711 [Trichonephila clavipes]
MVYERRFDCFFIRLSEMWKPMELRERTGKNLNDGFEWLCRNRSSVKEENHYVSRSFVAEKASSIRAVCRQRVLDREAADNRLQAGALGASDSFDHLLPLARASPSPSRRGLFNSGERMPIDEISLTSLNFH